jgi:hypothetical protein
VADAAPLPPKGSKDRSPSFPFIPLGAAIQRLEQFEKKFGRHPAPAAKAGLAWDMKEKSSQADQTLAALKSFGLVKYDGMGTARHASLTEEGRNYLRAQQDTIKKEILKVCALRPKIIRTFWASWGTDRPPNEVALDQLILQNSFSEGGAKNFLRVYDETVTYAGLASSDKIDLEQEPESGEDDDGSDGPDVRVNRNPPPPPPPPVHHGKVKVMDGERIVFTEETNPQNYLKLVASGDVDETMLEALEDYVKRQKKRLGRPAAGQPNGSAREPARVSLMITQEQKQRLREMGYAEEAIKVMTPEEAHKTLGVYD